MATVVVNGPFPPPAERPVAEPLSISDAEWRVMHVAWAAAGPVTAAEVIAAVTGGTGWNHRTVRTLLARLVEKGALASEPDPGHGRRHLYAARVPRDRCVRAAGRGFLDRVFGGDAGALLAHFAEGSDLSDAEVARLRALLDEAERRNRGGGER